MRCTWSGLLLAILLATSSWAGEIVLENRSPQPLVYQGRTTGREAWSKPQTLAAGSRHTYSSQDRLIVRFQTGGSWTTTVLQPDRRFHYQQDAAGSGEIVDDRWQGSARPQTRRVTVLAIADETYRRLFPDWEDRIAEIVATASSYFDEAFAIRLKLVACRPWKYEAAAPSTPEQLVAHLLQVQPPDTELVIGWIAQKQTIPGEPSWYVHSWSSPFGRHILIADLDRRLVYGTTEQLVQRLAVTFGAFYVLDRKSIMQKLLENVPYPFEFGDAARQVILLSRDFDFHVGVKSLRSESAQQIRALYRQHHHPADSPLDDPISRAYRAQGDRPVQGKSKPKQC